MDNNKIEVKFYLPTKQAVVSYSLAIIRESYELLKMHSGPIAIVVLFYVFATGAAENKGNTKMLTTNDPAKLEISIKEAKPTDPSGNFETKKNWGTGNEAAPVSPKYLTEEMAEKYIKRFSKVAITEMGKYNVPASISLAQGLIESRAGTSRLAVANNNHFGIKCFSRRCRKGHCSNFTDDTHKDFFRKFSTPWESWREHSRMISSGRYAKLKKNGRDFRKWAYGLKSIGYATDRNYAEKLIGTIEKYELWKYDQ